MKEYFKKIAILSVVWTFAGIFWVMARQFGQELVDEPPAKSLLAHASFFLSLGVIAGITFVFVGEFLTKKLKTIKSFGVSIFANSLIYLLTFFILNVIGAVLFMLPQVNQIKWNIIFNYLFSKEGALLLFYLFFILLLIDFIQQMDKKFGPGNLVRMLKGEFYKPKEVERIVMFLDLKSSTAIAEKIGNIKFSQLLQDCFQDLSIVREYSAEIYQYVGDEVVLIWEKPKGLKDLNCLSFYFAFSKVLRKKSDYYRREYGILPKFKCGCHVGKVIMTEIGQIKREIAYHGDVMNTASRIQDQCTKYQKEFLLSEDLFKLLPSTTSSYHFKMLDQVSLRGRTSDVRIYGIESSGNLKEN
ncbi:adenylate/guanylate cyclase domain-containing protein [Maribacter sp. HS]|uniref:adenylate/guanylate cyclase domain-containing protein n=1 Tax=Maribacter sp. HS TaxID=3110480 RepID=UPI003A8C1EAC